MPILLPDDLPDPPKPLAPEVRIVNADGRPTADFHRWLILLHEWQRVLRALLTR